MMHLYFHLKLDKFFFLQDSKDKKWTIVIKMKFRDLYDIRKGIVLKDNETYTQCICYNIMPTAELNDVWLLLIRIFKIYIFI